MSKGLALVLIAAAGLYLAAILALVVAGRRSHAAALVRFIPDCVVLLRRLVVDPRVPASRKLVLALLVAYLLSPIDLVPDFVPVAGQLDDVLVAGLALRVALRRSPPSLIEELWPGPAESLRVVERLALGAR